MGNDKTNNLVYITQKPQQMTFANFALGRRVMYYTLYHKLMFHGLQKVETNEQFQFKKFSICHYYAIHVLIILYLL
jgi:hypothetical protein